MVFWLQSRILEAKSLCQQCSPAQKTFPMTVNQQLPELLLVYMSESVQQTAYNLREVERIIANGVEDQVL